TVPALRGGRRRHGDPGGMRAEVVRDRSLAVPPRPERATGGAAARARLPRPALFALRGRVAARLGVVIGKKLIEALASRAEDPLRGFELRLRPCMGDLVRRGHDLEDELA